MAAYLNRTISMMSGDGPHNRTSINALNDHRPMKSSQIDNSPLQVFVKAKKKINEIFGNIDDYVGEAVDYIKVVNKQNLIDEGSVSQTQTFKSKVKGIKDVLARDHMKVAFFGRTSNGKSSVINAMLQDKILPSGIGHTTNCFLQVEGSPTDEPYLVLEGSDEHCAVESVGQLAHALCKEKLSESQLVRVFWPKHRCSLLRDDVVFVDSPGVDVSPNLDEWIDKHCLDADVFVLVANAESTLMTTEKNFFHKVSTKLSKPNIFVLNNRWDASASEPEFLDQVRKQHQERSSDFLVKELKVCTLKEAEERIFFISAKEALLARLAERRQATSTPLAEGFQSRYFEFQDFEKKFEECISKSAVKTKFEQHTQRGRLIANWLIEIKQKKFTCHSQVDNRNSEMSVLFVILGEAVDYIKVVNKQNLIDEGSVSQTQTFKSKVKGIEDVLARDHMKVAFFGRTSNGKSSVINAMLQDKSRYLEFQDFEKKFEECISKSAVKTKFEQHTQRGRLIANELREVLEKIYVSNQKLREDKLEQRKQLHAKIDYIEKQLTALTHDMKQKIHHMVEDVEQRVSKALSEEIRRLSNLVDEFNLPFHPEPVVLNVYKKELHLHVENGLGSNLRARLSTALALNIEASQKEMAEKVETLIPEGDKGTLPVILPRRQPFEIFYRLNCDNLCADFREDLEFRFSYGITALIQRFSSGGSFLSIANKRESPTTSIIPLTPTDQVDGPLVFGNASAEDWSVLSKIALASVTSQGTMGGLLITGFLLKTVGWRIIIFTGAIYSSLYLYERLTWTNKAKERSFKRQYVGHATRKLRMIVDLTSANCSHQVQQELSGSFARLCHLVDEATSKMDNQLKGLEKELRELEKAASDAKVLRNKANFIINDLGLFEDAYLKLHQ